MEPPITLLRGRDSGLAEARLYEQVEIFRAELDWKTSCGEGTKLPLAPRLLCPSHTRISLHPDTCFGSANCDSDARRGGERHIRSCLDPGCQRQNARDRPLQHRCGSLATMVGILRPHCLFGSEADGRCHPYEMNLQKGKNHRSSLQQNSNRRAGWHEEFLLSLQSRAKCFS